MSTYMYLRIKLIFIFLYSEKEYNLRMNPSFLSLRDFLTLANIVGKHVKDDLSLTSMITYKDVMSELLTLFDMPTEPTQLIRTCTQYNCLCWKANIKKFCIIYNTCLICYNDHCIRCIEGFTKPCNGIFIE